MERARSFGSVAELYDRYRPSPPEEAAALLGPLAGRDVVEVAAGTGIVTRFLLSLGASVTAVEPDDQMRAVLARRTPGVRAVAGTAEDLPLPDSCADVVVTSSAWHWFAQPAASEEFARVLRDAGRLLILGNGLVRRHP
ncbi:MAG: class I SAM-dependent methyltransferase, partial [Acidobacteriota bacterium]|nr:class I SAM-dependent methyltransferase [Acidobacteriota bacterium]